MEDWVTRALARWPDVPAVYGWLSLDRRGRWRIRGELITRPQIIDTINANYAADERGCWYFQNGPQRGYMELEVAPLVLSVGADGETLVAHTGVSIQTMSAAWLDEEGSLLLSTDAGPGLLADAELSWALDRLGDENGDAVGEARLARVLAQASGTLTGLSLRVGVGSLEVLRVDREELPRRLGFVRSPAPD